MGKTDKGAIWLSEEYLPVFDFWQFWRNTVDEDVIKFLKLFTEIDLNEIKEPLLACPNDPDDIKTLSEVANTNIDEVFIGSCMTNIGHFRAAGKLLENTSELPSKLWVSPPTKMDKHQLTQEGYYEIFENAGVIS